MNGGDWIDAEQFTRVRGEDRDAARERMPHHTRLRLVMALIGGGVSLLLSLPMIFNGWLEHVPTLGLVAVFFQLVVVPFISATVALIGIAYCGGPWLSDRMFALWILAGTLAPSAFAWASWANVWFDLVLWLGVPLLGILFLRDQCGTGSRAEMRWLSRFHDLDRGAAQRAARQAQSK